MSRSTHAQGPGGSAYSKPAIGSSITRVGPLAASASLRIRDGFGPVRRLRFRMAHGFLQVHPPDSEVYRIGDRMQHRLEGLAKSGTQLRFRNAGGYYAGFLRQETYLAPSV